MCIQLRAHRPGAGEGRGREKERNWARWKDGGRREKRMEGERGSRGEEERERENERDTRDATLLILQSAHSS